MVGLSPDKEKTPDKMLMPFQPAIDPISDHLAMRKRNRKQIWEKLYDHRADLKERDEELR